MVKTRNFTFILYPESAPSDWKTILEDLLIPTIISPLHDKDVNSDGTAKKPHYHIILQFDGPKTQASVEKLMQCLSPGIAENGAVKPINTFAGACRYLCHLDHPNKAQYDVGDVISMNGINYMDVIRTAEDNRAIERAISTYIFDNGITNYSALYQYAMLNNDEWFDYIRKNSVRFFTLIKSFAHRMGERY